MRKPINIAAAFFRLLSHLWPPAHLETYSIVIKEGLPDDWDNNNNNDNNNSSDVFISTWKWISNFFKIHHHIRYLNEKLQMTFWMIDQSKMCVIIDYHSMVIDKFNLNLTMEKVIFFT